MAHRLHAVVGALSLVIATTSLMANAEHADAQSSVSGGQFRRQNVHDDTLLQKGRFEVMLTLAGNVTSTTVTPEEGSEVSASSTYVNPNLVLGYMVTDVFEIRGLVGGQILSNSVTIKADGSETTTESSNTSVLLGAQALAQKDFALGIAGYVGVGGGYFFGTRSEPNPSESGTSVDYSNSGGLVQALAGLLMQPGPRLIMRGGLRADTLFGHEEPENEMLGIAQDTLNIQVVAEFGVGLRF